MAYVELQLAKKHLNVEESFTEDDEYIECLIEAAEAVVEKDICEELKALSGEDGKSLPAPLRQCHSSDGWSILCKSGTGCFCAIKSGSIIL